MAQGFRQIPEDEIQQAMADYSMYGLNEAERRTGMSKKTIMKYAEERGVRSPTPQDVVDAMKINSIRAAQERTRHVNGRIDTAIDRTLDVLHLAHARELQILHNLGDTPDPDMLGAISRARTQAVKDLEGLLKRAGLLVGSADGAEWIGIVKQCIVAALDDSGLPVEMRAAFGQAFAHRLRMAQSGEDPMKPAGELEAAPDDEDDDVDEVDGEAEES